MSIYMKLRGQSPEIKSHLPMWISETEHRLGNKHLHQLNHLDGQRQKAWEDDLEQLSVKEKSKTARGQHMPSEQCNLRFNLKYFKLCAFVSVYGYTHVCPRACRGQRDWWICWAGVTGRHDLPYVGPGKQTGSSVRTACTLTTDTFFQPQLDNLNKIKSRGFPK